MNDYVENYSFPTLGCSLATAAEKVNKVTQSVLINVDQLKSEQEKNVRALKMSFSFQIVVLAYAISDLHGVDH